MTLPLAIFDQAEYLTIHQIPAHILPQQIKDYMHSIEFLKSYAGRPGTFNSYRREVERLFQWTWLIHRASLQQLNRHDLEKYIKFCQHPPKEWIADYKVPRFKEKQGERKPNPEWRPFVMPYKKNQSEKEQQFILSQGAIQEIFAILSTYFNFLIADEYIFSNPIALMRQKSKFIQKSQQAAPIRRLSLLQWQMVLETVEQLASQEPQKHERTRFILHAMYGMYLRISELTASDRWIPTMDDFAKDHYGNWWFTTVGKGNKRRQIAVSELVLESLKRWRIFLGLPALPTPGENQYLIPKIKGVGPIAETVTIRRLIQQCFDLAVLRLKQQQFDEEAQHLEVATVHWLRHTSISEDVKIRPREHVRDDAGHASSATTDRYIDVELTERHRSAQNKKILPVAEN
jgi:site-specific recombinase XerD